MEHESVGWSEQQGRWRRLQKTFREEGQLWTGKNGMNETEDKNREGGGGAGPSAPWDVYLAIGRRLFGQGTRGKEMRTNGIANYLWENVSESEIEQLKKFEKKMVSQFPHFLKEIPELSFRVERTSETWNRNPELKCWKLNYIFCFKHVLNRNSLVPQSALNVPVISH